jgi:hypothetical protein
MWWAPNRAQFSEMGKFCLHPERRIETQDLDGCAFYSDPSDLENNVPQHASKGTMTDPNPNKVDGPTEILIATFGTKRLTVANKMVSDLDWLRWCLRSIRRHCSGFQGITIAHPEHEGAMFRPLVDEFGVRLHPHPEPKGKGFLSHQIQMANAERIVPSGTRYVLHCDADCIFRMPTTPEHFFWNDRPYHIIRSWASLGVGDPAKPSFKVISDCFQWKAPTDRQLGYNTDVYTMCMNTGVFPVDFYPAYRAHVEKVQRKPFEAWMLEGKNDHPCTRMDWTAMGAYAHRFMHDRFTWFDAEKPPYPVDRKQAFWSHAGISAETEAQIRKLIGL